MKKLLASFLTLALLAGLLAACSEGGEGSSSSQAGNSQPGGSSASASQDEGSKTVSFPLEEPLTMSMFASTVADTEMVDNGAFQLMAERTNIQWEVQSAMWADLSEKLNILLNSGSYPDVLFKSGINGMELQKYGNQGIFVDLMPYLEEYAPNFWALMNSSEAIYSQTVNADGKVYGLPQIVASGAAIPLPYINTKWLENVNMPEPTNPDELYEVLKAFGEKDANGNGDASDEIPILFCNAYTPQMLLPYFGLKMDFWNFTYIRDDGSIGFVTETDNFRQFLEFMAKIYGEGLMYKDSFTIDPATQSAIGQPGDTIGMFIDFGPFLTVGREADFDYQILTPFVSGAMRSASGVNPGCFVVTDACQNIEEALAWVDYLYTEEGGILAFFGVEDKSYAYNDDGSWSWVTGETDDINTVRAQYSFFGSGGANPGQQPWDFTLKMEGDPNETRLYEEIYRVTPLFAEPYPILNYTEEQNKLMSQYKADIEPYLTGYIAEITTGVKDLDATWDEFQSTLDNMGVQELVALYQDAYSAATA